MTQPALPTRAAVVIIGGGVMGASTAYHLAKRGVKDVVLLEREEFFGQGSTGRCAGGIRHQFSTSINIELSIRSLAMLRDFEAQTGQAIDIKLCGYLFLLSTPEQVAQFERNVALQNSHGVQSEILTVEQIARRVPLLNLDGIIGGSYYGGDGIADPSGVVNGYIAAAREHGASAYNGVTVTGIDVEDGAVTAVHTNHGSIQTSVVVNAAGPWSAPIAAMAGIDLPVTPERQQILVTTPMPTIPADFPFIIDFGQRLYFHREGGGLLTGMSVVGEPPTFEQTVNPDWTMGHMDAAMERLPIMETAGKLTEWAGLYEVTPDAHPIIGPLAEVRGFYAVTGFSGHGFMHGPIAGLLISEQILDGAAHTLDITALRAERFAEGQLITEFNVV
ncbi:MAG: FAD-binding oxidoreductase [Chloroflexi bacterium]|nr:FAD-binding oxidoreductase [Chloroflexota bacterium]MCC6892353.1 FAD-binding oxidoreductase [Anaerolineae bacterium]